MQAKIITLATSKGGVGKSTLARNLAAHWVNVGQKVAIIDSDPQGSIIGRHDPEGLLKNLTVIAEPEESVANLVEEIKDQYSHIIIDTGGFRNRTTIRALIKSDLAIIPLKASTDDVAGALETHNLIVELNKTPEPIKIVKVRKMACRSLPGRGSHTGLRLIYASYGQTIVFLELYFKSDQEREAHDRILDFINQRASELP